MLKVMIVDDEIIVRVGFSPVLTGRPTDARWCPPANPEGTQWSI